MDINKKNRELISNLLKIAIKDNEFVNFVLMMPNYCIETRDLNGFVKPNRYYTMQAIYDYYNENPKFKIDELLYNTLINISREYKGEQAIETVLETVQYQLDFEKKNLAPFKIDCQSILNELRLTLLKNKEMYLQQKKSFDYVPFWNNIENYNTELQEKFNHKVL